MERESQAPAPDTPSGRSSKTGPPVLNSRDLFNTGREVVIEHGEDRYRLCLTSSNKLILTK